MIWEQISNANKYIDTQAPWALKKTDPDRMAAVLGLLAEAIRQFAILSQPFMPHSAGKLLDQLQIPATERGFDQIGGQGRLAAGTEIEKPVGVFPRFQEDTPA